MYYSNIMSENQNVPAGKSFVMLPPPPPEDTKSSLLSNILAIAGFIIVIVVIIWGLVHLANISRSWFGSLFGTSTESTIKVSAPESANSGKAFEVEWEYEPEVTGSYVFLYQCVNGFQFRAANPAGVLSEIPCGAAYTIPADGNKISVTPILVGAASTTMPISVIFLPSVSDSGAQAEGSASIVILGGETRVVTTPTPRPTPAPTPAPRPAAPADLAVRILATGVIDTYSGVFVNRAPVSPSETAAVQFEIVNVGGTASGMYYFTASLPTTQVYAYSSPVQVSLTPGSRMVNTLRFTQMQPGGGMFTVSVDPSNLVRESNESNNYVSQFISAPNWGPYNQYPQYPYVQQYPYAY